MTTIATPSILNQANGSFAENEINKHMIASSYHETGYNTQLIDKNLNATKIDNINTK